MREQLRLKFWALFLAVLLTMLAGWAGLKGVGPLFPVFCLGIVGAIPMLMIEGVHGGGAHVENIFGETIFVVVNVAFYYFVLLWILGRIFRPRPHDSL